MQTEISLCSAAQLRGCLSPTQHFIWRCLQPHLCHLRDQAAQKQNEYILLVSFTLRRMHFKEKM